jgi:hypothetical protein
MIVRNVAIVGALPASAGRDRRVPGHVEAMTGTGKRL